MGLGCTHSGALSGVETWVEKHDWTELFVEETWVTYMTSPTSRQTVAMPTSENLCSVERPVASLKHFASSLKELGQLFYFGRMMAHIFAPVFPTT